MALSLAGTKWTQCAIKVCFLCLVLIRLTRVVCLEHSSASELENQQVLLSNNTSYEAQNARALDSTVSESSKSNGISSRILLILKLLQLVNRFANQNNSEQKNNNNNDTDAISESRSMSSWFRFKKPTQRQESQYFNSHTMPNSVKFPGHNGDSRPMFEPNYQNFGKSQLDSNSLFLLPSLADTAGIDYWLKLIENANLDERPARVHPPSSKTRMYSKAKPTPAYKRPKMSSHKNKMRHNERKNFKLKSKPETYPRSVGENFDTEQQNGINGGDSKSSTGAKKMFNQMVEFDTSPRCDKFTDEICIDDFEYPEHAILEEIFKRKDLFQLMYSEVKSDTPLVDGIPRDMEENFSQDYYYSNNEPDSDDYESYPNYGNNHTEASEYIEQDPSKNTQEKGNKASGFVCRSEVLYAKPKLARNIKGKWRVIVNAGDFTQTVRMEKCTKPNSECRFIAEHKYDSRCAQISAIHRLLVFEKGKGFYIDTFRIPTACTCHVQTNKSDNSKMPSHLSEEGSSALLNVKRDKVKSNLGETLWSLLGTEPTKNSEEQQRGNSGNSDFIFFPEQASKNSANNMLNANLDLLKLLPQLASVTPETVLNQLLEGYINGGPYDRYGNKLTLGEFNNGQMNGKLSGSNLQRLLFARNEIPKENDNNNQNNNNNNNKRQSEKPMTFSQPGTTTIVNPAGGGQGAPVVQVIHVPVSSSMMSPSESGNNVNADHQHAHHVHSMARNRLHPVFSNFQGVANPMIPANNNNGNTGSSSSYYQDVPKQSKYLISTRNSYMHSPSKSNSSVAPPPLKNGTKIVTNTTNESNKSMINNENLPTQESNQRKKDNNNSKESLDKINFSYHPILEYIVN